MPPSVVRRRSAGCRPHVDELKIAATLLAVASLTIVGCGESGQSTSSAAPTNVASNSTSSDEPTTTQPTVTAHPTTVPDPTVFNPNNVGDIRELSSFVFTIAEAHTFNGTYSESSTTIGYIKEPFAAYSVQTYDGARGVNEYSVNGRFYHEYGDWYLYEKDSRSTPDIFTELTNEYAFSRVLSAVYVGEEELAGIAAYHFTFDETNLLNFDPDGPSFEVEGDFYLAKQGNYLLYVHFRSVAAGEGFELIDEFTETLTSVNELTEITLPSDFVPMDAALDVGVEFSAVLPPGSALSTMVRFGGASGGIAGIGVDYYRFITPVKNNAEMLDHFRTLPPTNGWTVTHIGHVNLHLEPNNCETANECVILQNGGTQVVVSFGGEILVEFDYDRVFSPL
ncbi:MAG: hypothetical protein ABL953_01060 [Ilumatobacteraceae bacterium]